MGKDVIKSVDMRALEWNAEYFGISRLQLMENAGKAVADEIASRFSADKHVVVVCGLGGNGGDGFVAARHLNCKGFKVEVVLGGQPENIRDEATRCNWLALKSSEIPIHPVSDSSLIPELEADVIVDSLLGIGLKGAPRPPIDTLVRKINEAEAFRLAVDVPTAVDADSGKKYGEAVKADLTVTFHKLKPGLESVREVEGEVVVKSIGIPSTLETRVGPGDVLLIKKERPFESRKGDFGRLLVVGGSEIFSGAPALTALAAYQTGVDVVYVAAPERAAHDISSMSPNLITMKLEGKHLNPRNMPAITQCLKKSSAMILGPGLGNHIETQAAVKEVLEAANNLLIPVLVDADAISPFKKFSRKARTPVVITPHQGEYKLLTGRLPPRNLDERKKDVLQTASKLHAVVLLKSAVDVISDGKRIKLNFTGNPGMTVGGTGDVLSGIIGAFLAQKIDPFSAAVAGAFVNGTCGDMVESEKGHHILATDLLNWIPHVIDDPMVHKQVRESAA